MKSKFFGDKTNQTLTRILWAAGGLIIGVIIISAVDLKRKSLTDDVIININPLPDNSRLITDENVLTLMTRSLGRSPQGTTMGDLDLERLEERVLEKDPFVQDADVYVDARNKIHVDIVQRQPIIRIIDGNGKSYYLDSQGKYMPLSANFTARIPVATGYIAPFTPDYMKKKRHILQDLFFLTQKIRENEFMLALTEQLFITKKREFIIIPKVGNHKILLGGINDIDDKFKRLKTFYEEALPYEGWQKHKTINLKYEGQIVCKKK